VIHIDSCRRFLLPIAIATQSRHRHDLRHRQSTDFHHRLLGQPDELSIERPERWDVPADLREDSLHRVMYRDRNCGLLWYQDRGDAPGEHARIIGRYKGHGFERIEQG
jgi:hypothetical protein